MKLADLSTGPDWIVWIVFIILSILSVVLISGHGSWLIAGYNTCGDYCVDTKEKLVEILYFRHFAKHFTFTSEGKNSRNKHLKNYFDVSVVIDIGCGNTNEK